MLWHPETHQGATQHRQDLWLKKACARWIIELQIKTEVHVAPTKTGKDTLGKMRPTPTLQDVMQAIAASQEALEQKVDAISADLGLLHDDHRCLLEWVTTTERKLSETISAVTVASNRLNDVDR
ncbi:hypothetical protein NDU88_011988 [Pleurodeles waltl]|uniref:Uncharacterized protein n=1 Tax=Pleurodeles waltl TaxID=8319 RepID=A0AAV7R079_PLEWA|nr:hypothetical protein NDU88_011988 [Pleurodeles waltl]